MYRIIKTNGAELGITDAPVYIKYGESGSFTPATAEDAIGVAYKSVPYNLFGHNEIEGAETVLVKEMDGGEAANALGILLGVRE